MSSNDLTMRSITTNVVNNVESYNSDRYKDFQIIKLFSLIIFAVIMLLCAIVIGYCIYFEKTLPIPKIEKEFGYELITYTIYLFIGIYGIWATSKEKLVLILVYGMIVALAGIAFIIVHKIDVIPLNKRKVAIIVDDIWRTRLKNDTLTQVQQKLGCCGRINSSDYIVDHDKIPASCYNRLHKLYEDGCFEKVFKAVNETNFGFFTGVTFYIFLLQCLSFITTLVYVGAILEREFPDDDW